MLSRPAPTIDLTIFQKVFASLRADMDSILDLRGPKHETTPIETTEDTVFVSLYTTPIELPPEPCERGNKHYSSRTTEGDEAYLGRRRRLILRL